MSPLSSADELGQLVSSLFRPTAAVELAVFSLCLVAAWAVVRLLRGGQADAGSIWFGDRIFDGVLFPVLALLLALLARWLLRDQVPPAVFRVVVPVMLSLVVIRLVVRVLHRTYPTSSLMRVVERSVSWIAWVAVILWVTGLLPRLPEAPRVRQPPAEIDLHRAARRVPRHARRHRSA